MEPILTTAVLTAFTVISATAPDRMGHRIGGISSLRWGENRRGMMALPDRGYLDGMVDYVPRFHEFEVIETEKETSWKLLRTVPFRDMEGEFFSGLAKTTSTHIDPEGLAIVPDGTLYVTDEYIPAVYHFDREGRMLGRLMPPKDYIPDEKEEIGRTENRGFEGLCLMPDGRRLAVLLQGPLAQDGGREGAYTRLLLYDVLKPDEPPREYRVAMPSAAQQPPEQGLKQKDFAFNEVEAVSNNSLLLLERSNRGKGHKPGGRAAAAYKRVVWVDINDDGSTTKTPYLDIVKIAGEAGMEPQELGVKFESLAWGRSAGGKRSLWLAVDNDFKSDVDTQLFRISVP